MISIVILTKNEEKNIFDCLEKVLWADEVILVDDYSEDRTLDVVKALDNKKIKIFKNRLNNDFSSQRNFGLSRATKPWILFVDADERLTPELKEELNSIIITGDSSKSGYVIKRTDVIWGKELRHGETGNIKLLRLAKRGSGAWIGRVHEKWQIDGNIGELEGNLLHYPHQNINEFLSEINLYSTIRASELYEMKVKASASHTFLYPVGKFVKNYLIKLGFLDGLEGLILATMMSMHSFLVRAKLWLLWQKK